MKSSDGDEGFGDLLARAQIGDPVAFDGLVRWLERPLVGFLRARGAEDAEDLANDVLVRVLRGVERFEGGRAQFRAWVFRIARNVLVDDHRYRARRLDVVPTLHNELPETAVADDFADDFAERVGQLERVEALLGGLTAEQREVLLLRIVAGLSVEETSQVVGRRPGAVRALQHRALVQLRTSLSGRP
jgi:RNA polymerase sigma-70 factor (ECF subfamily)